MSDNYLNKKYNIELKVLTPLHIGAGTEKDWVKGADYVVDNNNIYILNHRKVVKNLKGGANELSNFLQKKDDIGLKNKLLCDLETVSDNVFNSPVRSSNDIKTFCKNGLTNKPVVPGSSLKGAIRSILLNYFIDNKSRSFNKGKLLEKEIFGSADKGDEFMRFIKVGDTQFEKTNLVNTNIFNLYGNYPELRGGWKKTRMKTIPSIDLAGFNTIYEIIEPNNTGILSISLSYMAFNRFHKNSGAAKQKSVLNNGITEQLFDIINKYSIKYINKQIAFFDKYSNDETDAIIESLNRVKSEIPNDNSSCVLKMSAGSGFHSITGDWQFDTFSINGIDGGKSHRGKYNGKKSAKSRKIATDGNSFDLMGFVKLSLLTQEEIERREAEKKAIIEEKKREEAERLAKEIAEKERREAEKKAKIEAEKKVEEERIKKAEEEERKRKQLIIDEKRKIEQAQKANEEKKSQLLSQGLSILEEEVNYNLGKNAIKNYKLLKGTIDESQFSDIKSFVQRFFVSTDKEWRNFKRGKRWKEIIGWVGKGTANQWYNELKE